jgi:flagellar biogenesis protein FliO
MEIVSILGVLAALAVSGHLLKRFGRAGGPARRVSVEQRLPIANGCQLVLVRLDNQELLLATNGSSCTLLTTHVPLPAPPPAVIELRREQRACAG